MKLRNLILVLAAAGVLAAQTGDADVMLQRAIRKESVEGDLKGAIDAYKRLAQGRDRAVTAKALLRLGECYEKQGDAEAQRTYERLVREFSDQTEQAREARARLSAGGSKSVVAQLIAKRVDFNRSGRVTPDGRLFIFVDSPPTCYIAVRDLQTGVVRRLTNQEWRGPRGSTPVPSRDGKQIAYAWWVNGSQMEFRVINLDGSGMRTVPGKVKDGAVFELWDWSPDGKRLLARGRGIEQLGPVTVDVATGEVRPLQSFTGYLDFAGGAFSPDGRWVVYSRQVRQGDPDWDIFALDTKTGQETAIVTGAGADQMPMWAPDSDKIVFRSDRNGKNAIWMVRFRDGQAAGPPVLIRPDAGDYDPKGISRDGSLFYRLSHVSKDVYQATVDPQTLRVQGAPARLVDTYFGRNSMPTWSPSGDSFAYYSERDQSSRLVVHRPDGQETVVAEPARWTEYLPHWCGGGDRLLSWGTPSTRQIRLFDARTGAASPPDLRINGVRAPSWDLGVSPDCQSVYVSSYSGATKQRRIYRYDVSTGKETDLLTDAGEGWSAEPTVSPDGRWLALHGKLEGGKEVSILVLSTAGGPLRMLVPAERRYHFWTPDSKRLMYVQSVERPDGQATENELYWVPVEGGVPRSMGIRMPGALFPSLHPDGKRLLFSASESTNELWVLRNLPLK
ncbi:MAG: tetratricopeptide repeat protein [Bryobacterales bacterium]|nr:tetratricopeptide repeat protein [Bryobacterales bacterium]